MKKDIRLAIVELLDANGIEHRALEHEPTRTSQESADIRGESLGTGAKALVLKTGDEFRLLVLPADKKLNSSAVKKYFSVKKVRFATSDELLELTGLVPGSVPPFGQPILPFELYADVSMGDKDRIGFNAGSLTNSILMSGDDWRALACPTMFDFAAPIA